MLDLHEIIFIVIGAIFVNNIVLAQFLGCCPFLGVSKKLSSAIGMGMAVTFVLTLASVITWLVQVYLLERFDIGYLQTIAFILVIASLVQFVEMVIKKHSPDLYKALGVYLPLITTNCAVLGVAIINIQKSYGFINTLFNGFANGLSFTLALILFAGIRERLEDADIPKSMQGTPIALITAALMSIAFLGFSGLI
ncbi:MAG TPA: electron transport complex subunit RsxA [Peptococcaceae bacterium]|mgnify:CR=1 FL=1|jgi:electron transport complex protein RnfA|nr:electron transport complex subunit RsxA [Clostridia bacterium]HOB81546.1 electron transport complex subunit RsxA [Peptococcaceae bacterium]HQD53634.1 electron transport complex subunit RsxA [Peptococcaceae bacterium]